MSIQVEHEPQNKDIQPNVHFDLDLTPLEQVRKLKALANKVYNEIAVDYDNFNCRSIDRKELLDWLDKIGYLSGRLYYKLKLNE